MRYIIGIIALGLIILIHESGHFLLARLNHITVLEFSVGMGPRLLSFTGKSGTVFCLKAIPFGGSCMMKDEEIEEEGSDGVGSFVNAPLISRLLVVSAGPVFNFLLAFLICLIIAIAAGSDKAIVAEVLEGSPEAEAGLAEGDEILRWDGSRISSGRELYIDLMLDGYPTEETEVVIRRDGQKQTIVFEPETHKRYMLGFSYADNEEGDGVLVVMLTDGSALKAAGMEMNDVITAFNGTPVKNMQELIDYLDAHPLDGSPVDVTYQRNGREHVIEQVVPNMVTEGLRNFGYYTGREHYGLPTAIVSAAGEVGFWVRVTWKSIGGLFTGRFGINDMAGPVGMVKSVGDSYGEATSEGGLQAGILTLLDLMAMISANLGIMNLIPLPALDGGRILLMFIEAVRGKSVNRTIEERINYVGFMLLFALMIFITLHDIIKLF